jgi:integrase|tara:strand:- start:4113 stop:5228 length:1116 start_codon:yes stop_codon:yes gene_type:complete
MSNYYISEIKPYEIKSKSYQGFCFRFKSATMKSYGRKVAKTRKELNLIRKKMTSEFENNVTKTEVAMFKDIAEMALKMRLNAVGRRVNGIRQRSYENDERHIRLHLEPFYDGVSIKDITTGKVNSFIDEKANSNMSAKSIRHCINTLSMIMKFSVDRGYIMRNPCSSDERKEIQGSVIERGGYSHDHISKLLKVEKTLYLDTFIMFSAFTGISANELQGLQWEDINFTKSEVKVTRNVYRYDAQDLKNNFRVRVLGLPAPLMNLLKKWKLQSKCNYWIFPNADNIKPFEQNAMRKLIKTVCKHAGVPDYGLGGFRKYYNTSMIGEVPDHIRKARMGHSKNSKTAEVHYTVIDLEQARSPIQAQRILEKLIS